MASEDEGRIVKLVSHDNDEYEVPVDVASMSELVKNVLENHDDAQGVKKRVELSRVSSVVLKRVIDFMMHHKEDPMVLVPKRPFKRRQLPFNLKDEVQVWYSDFMAIDPTGVFELAVAANYMGIAQLVDLCCCIVVMGETGFVESFKERAFSFCCEKLTSIEIPGSLESIGDSAFECSALKSVTFPGRASLKTIDSCAFFGCKQLTSIEIPGSVESIGDSAFDGCSALESVTFATGDRGSLKTINSCAFRRCKKLTSIEIPASVESIGECAFQGCSALESVTFPTGDGGGSLKTIDVCAFLGCKKLTIIEIPGSVESIGKHAFRDCSALKSVIFPTGDGGGSLKTINFCAFRFCKKLTSIEIPRSVESIGLYAFHGCSALESVTFPTGSLKTIHDYAFSGCKKLTSVEIPRSVESIGEHAFHVRIKKRMAEYRALPKVKKRKVEKKRMESSRKRHGV